MSMKTGVFNGVHSKSSFAFSLWSSWLQAVFIKIIFINIASRKDNIVAVDQDAIQALGIAPAEIDGRDQAGQISALGREWHCRCRPDSTSPVLPAHSRDQFEYSPISIK
jgi:hypothetical protein